MAKTMTQIQFGSQGGEVKDLQKLLNQNGYSLSEDGIFGSQTQSAVKDYQKKNNLAVDGIVGNKTWSALTGAVAGANAASNANKPFEYDDFSYDDFQYDDFQYDDFSYDQYQESDAVKDAYEALNTQLAQKPGEYQSQWQSQLNEVVNKIMNREEFSYDLNGDALYQQYKDKYIQQGKMAMGDAIGQASAMTGGYGNSYAQSVGQQMYQKELQNLNDIVPELYQMAYDKYNQEGQDLYNQFSVLGSQEERDYGRYRDSVTDWQNERGYLTDRYDSERNFDYSKYNNERNFAYGQYADDRNFAYGQYSDDRNLAYDKYSADRSLAYDQYSDDKTLAYNEHRNAIADAQWQAEFDEAKRQFDEQMATRNSSGGSSGGSGGSTGSGSGSGSGSTGSGSGSTGNATPKAIPDHIAKKAAEFEDNESLAEWAYSLEDSGVIEEGQAAQLISTYFDHNEKTVEVTDDKGNKSTKTSYSDMVKSTSGWSVVDNGGVNWLWGVDNNAIVKAPNGKQIRLDNLVDYLVDEGMSKSDAKSYVKKLQKNLGV